MVVPNLIGHAWFEFGVMPPYIAYLGSVNMTGFKLRSHYLRIKAYITDWIENYHRSLYRSVCEYVCERSVDGWKGNKFCVRTCACLLFVHTTL